MTNITISAPFRQSIPSSLPWTAKPIKEGVDEEVEIRAAGHAYRSDITTYVCRVRKPADAVRIVAAVNQFDSMVMRLEEIHEYLQRVLRGESSLQEAVNTITSLEKIILDAGGKV